MKKYFCFSIFLIFSFFISPAQEWQWGNHYDFPGVEGKSQIGGSDKNGNLYLTVSASSADHLDPWTHYFLIKLDSKGKLTWSKNIDEYAYGRIITDANGNSYIAWFDKIVKFGASGDKIWVVNTSLQKNFGSIFLSAIGGITINGLEKGPDSSRSFISQYNSSGQLLSTIYVQNTSLMAIGGGNGNYFLAKIWFPDPQTGNSGRLLKYDKNGILLFEKVIPHYPKTIISDPTGNIYIAGEFGYSAIEINGIKYQSPLNSYSLSYFIIKYDPDGELLWYKIISGNLGSNNLALDSLNNLYYSIDYSAEIKINEFELKGGTGGLLFMKFDPAGKIIWHNLTSSYNTGVYGYIYPSQIYSSKDGALFISGSMTGTLQFGPSLVQTSSDMYSELFVGKIDQSNIVGIKPISTFDQFNLQIYPNPSGEIFTLSCNILENQSYDYTVTEALGRIIYSKTNVKTQAEVKEEINLQSYAPGIYFLEFKCGDKRRVMKLLRN